MVWGTVDVLRAIGRVVKWPFQRLAWVVERWLVWPLQERTDGWSTPARILATVAVVALAVGAVAGGILLAKDPSATDGSTPAVTPISLTQVPATPEPGPPSLPFEGASPSTPLLKGAAPDFVPEADGGTAKAAGAVADSVPASQSKKATATPAAPAAESEAAGPEAIKVARRFAGAFVLYETARGKKSKIRTIFDETATAQLTRSLMKRPPRLPANVQVPKAKVLNIVPGPRSGELQTFSVSLLRVGVTSELRIDMERAKKSGKWQVTDVLG